MNDKRGQHILRGDEEKLFQVEQGKLDLATPAPSSTIFDTTSKPGWLITPWGEYERLRPLRRIIRDGPMRPDNPTLCWACRKDTWHTWPSGEKVCLTCHPLDLEHLPVYTPPAAPTPLVDIPPGAYDTLAPEKKKRIRPERKDKPHITAEQAKHAWVKETLPKTYTPQEFTLPPARAPDQKKDEDLPL